MAEGGAAARARAGTSVNDALAYLKAVKETFKEEDQGDKYDAFTSLLTDSKSGRLDRAVCIAKMEDLLKGYPHLMLGFYTFFPREKKITDLELEGDEQPPQPKKLVDMGKARKFADKIKTRLQGDGEHVFEAFCDILKKHHTEDKSVAEIYLEAAPLLKGHPDLLREFGEYVT